MHEVTDKNVPHRAGPLERLKEGNERFVANRLSLHDFEVQRRELTGGQRPFAAILTCSDSRVPPEYIFNQSLGQLFVVRVAGNVVTPEVLASLEYAVFHLECRLLVVMGHGACGAVKAALEGGPSSANMKALLNRLEPAISSAREKEPDAGRFLETAVTENARLQLEEILRHSETVRELVESGRLDIFSAHYHLHTGRVDFFKHGRD